MTMKISSLDRRKFLRGSGVALALPWFESFNQLASAASPQEKRKRLACFYLPDGVPMPLEKDPSFNDWSWFPHGAGKDFTLTKCMETLEPLKQELTVFSGLSHPAVRRVHGHANADQFLTGADTGADGDYQNSISLDQVFAEHAGKHTRHASLVMSTDGGTGSPRGSHTMSYNRNGKPIPAEHKPKRIFDMLFVAKDNNASEKLARSKSALDLLMEDTRSLGRKLSRNDRDTLQQYLDSVRDTEVKLSKAEQWLDAPIPEVDSSGLHLEAGPSEARQYFQTMYDLIYLAFMSDSTRVATFQLGRENGGGPHDMLSKAVDLGGAHGLTHAVKDKDGWQWARCCKEGPVFESREVLWDD